MLKKVLPVMVALAVTGGLAGCYVEDQDEPGGGGGTVIEREHTIERDAQPAPDVNINNTMPDQPDSQLKTETRTETETTP